MTEYRCVRCLKDVDLFPRDNELVCPACDTTYPVVDGAIPVFIDDPKAAANYYGSMFREDAARYEERYNVDSAHGRWVLERLTALEPGIRERSNGTVLEIGAGTGPMTRALEEHANTCRRLYVSDLSPEMLRVNRRQSSLPEGGGAVRYLACNVRNAPFPDSSLDLVIGMDILHHILNYPLALAELARVMKPGGVCVLKEPHRDAYRFLAFLCCVLLGGANRRRRPFSGLTRHDRGLIVGWQAHALRLMEVADRGDHDALADLDDKYFFDPKPLAREAREAGFARFSEANILFRPGQDIPVGPMFLDHFKGLGVSARGLVEIERTCADVDTTIGEFLLEHAPINTLFLFWK